MIRRLCRTEKNIRVPGGRRGAVSGVAEDGYPVYSAEMGRCLQLFVNSSFTEAGCSRSFRSVLAGSPQSPGSTGGMHLILDSQFSDYLPLATNNYFEEGFAYQVSPTPTINEGYWSRVETGKSIRLSLSLVKRTVRDADWLVNFFKLC